MSEPNITIAPASLFASRNRTVERLCRAWFLAGIVGFIGATQASGQQICRPAVAISDVKFSEWRLPTMERKWTALVSVDASRCRANSEGRFEIGFERLIENGVDAEFTEEFAWTSPSVKVGVHFWANEAVGRYWINKVSLCPCANSAARE